MVNAIKRHLGDKDGKNVPLNVFVWLDIFAGVPGSTQHSSTQLLLASDSFTLTSWIRNIRCPQTIS